VEANGYYLKWGDSISVISKPPMAERSVLTPANVKAIAEQFRNPTQNRFAANAQKALYFPAAVQVL